jgi:hypothetical protein
MKTKIAYKATKNMKCLNLTYEVGGLYEIDNIKMCSHGFHYCENMIDVLDHYEPSKDFVLLEIEILSENVIKDGNKSVTDKIKVLRIVPQSEHKLFETDGNGNVVFYKKSCGYICKQTFDERNNLLAREDSGGFSFKQTFDIRNNLLIHESSTGFSFKQTFDIRNNLLTYENSNHYSFKQTFDIRNNLLMHEDSDNYSCKQTFDERNNLLSCENSGGKKYKIAISK